MKSAPIREVGRITREAKKLARVKGKELVNKLLKESVKKGGKNKKRWAIGPLFKKKNGQNHHVASNKAIKSGFTKRYEKIFKKAGMTLEDPANKIFLEGHAGGHTKKYKKYVLRYLQDSTRGHKGTAYKEALINALNELKEELIKNPKLPYKGGL